MLSSLLIIHRHYHEGEWLEEERREKTEEREREREEKRKKKTKKGERGSERERERLPEVDVPLCMSVSSSCFFAVSLACFISVAEETPSPTVSTNGTL